MLRRCLDFAVKYKRSCLVGASWPPKPQSSQQGEQAAESRPVEEDTAPQSFDRNIETQKIDDLAQLPRAFFRFVNLFFYFIFSVFFAREARGKRPNFC